MSDLVIGKRYKLPHGYGSLQGREIPDPDNKDKLTTNFESLAGPTDARYAFIIEIPNTWAFKSRSYYASRKDIEEVV